VARVFVSYARDDRGVAGQIRRLLVEAGHEVFLDVDRRNGIRAGEDWKQRLYTELRGADAVVCVVSSSYDASQWCAIEVAVAQALATRLVPLSVQPGARHRLLDDVQHLDYAADPVSALAITDEILRGEAATGGWPDGRCPYPGLRAFDPDWQRVYFGRERDIAALAALLRTPAERATGQIIAVVGPSGCGKSSLVRAGLLPVMAREPGWWVLSPVVPGEDPVGALARELAAEAVRLGRTWSVAEVRARLADAAGLADLADELLVAASGRQRRRRLLLVVDQFEETLTRTSPQRRRQFARLLAHAAAVPVAVVTTLRPEYLNRMLSDPDLADLTVRQVPLRPLDAAALAVAVVWPARVAGIGVDDALVARMVADTGTGEALPLLAYALEQVAAGVARGGRLTSERYDQIGGVAAALSAQADAALADARTRTGRGDDEVIAGLLRLVTVDDTGRPARRRVAHGELPDPVRVELAAFVDRRLLATDEVDGVASVGVTHEALFTAWPPLAGAVAKARAAPLAGAVAGTRAAPLAGAVAGAAPSTRRDGDHATAEVAAAGLLRRRELLRAGAMAAIAGTVAISLGSDTRDAGATIANVGRVSLILDPGKLMTHEHRLPPSVRRGDLILGAIEVYDARPFRVPDGFVHLATATAGNEYGPKTVMFWRWADPGEARVVITFGPSMAKSSCVAVYRGVDPAGPVVDVATAANDGDPSITVGSVVAAERSRLVMVVGACSNTDPGSWIGSPVGMSRPAVGTASWHGMVVYDQAAQAGETNVRTAVRDGPTHQSAILVALRGR
jgi:Novel STAND NTPase 1/TIR domain